MLRWSPADMRHLLLLLLIHGALSEQSADLDDFDDAIECSCNAASFGPDMMQGELKSPLHPNNYCDNNDCTYEIEPSPSTAIMLIMESFQTELRHDWLDVSQVYQSGNQLSDVRMMRLSGDDGSIDGKKFVTALGNGLRLHFHSDGSEHRWQGFRARFVRFNESSNYKPCPPVFYEAVSAPTQLTGPARSSGAAECFFMINATEKNTDAVKLTVQSVAFDAEVRVFETEDTDTLTRTTALQTFRGITFLLTRGEDKTIVSRGKSLLVVLIPIARPIFYINGGGTTSSYFRAEFSRVVSPCNCQKTPYTIDAETKTMTITTPGYPKDYCDNLNCQYNLEGSNVFTSGGTHSALKLTFDSFDMENNVDYMSLYDAREAPRLLMSYTGSMVSSAVFTFNFYKAQLQVHTDQSVVRKGFNATVEEIERDNNCKCPTRQPREYSGPDGKISFDMPSDPVGCNYVDCFWTIVDPAEEGDIKHRVVIEIEYRLFRQGEAIIIQNGANSIRNERTVSHEHKTLVAMPPLDGADTTKETVEYNAAGGLLIWFHSAWEISTPPPGQSTTAEPSTVRMFKLSYEWKKRCECGEQMLTAGVEWKTLTSPDYPHDYCHNLRCNYTVSAPDGHRVVVNVTHFETEINEDFVGMFDGQNIMAPRLQWASGLKYFDHLIHSEGQYMFIVFSTDVSISQPGFSLLYRAEALNPDTAKKEDAERKEAEEAKEEGKRGGSSWGVVLALLLAVAVVAAAVVLVQHRRGRLSLGPKADAFFGGGPHASDTIGFMNGGANHGYTRHFSAAPSEMSLANEDE
uniref:CUB domain-containing protein n=1 Tax=Plectus sambesii TaxID=2011161 RepID=A0A914WV49_9BILA